MWKELRMIRKETYTQNNLNPDICDEAILYADREPTEEELFYIVVGHHI